VSGSIGPKQLVPDIKQLSWCVSHTPVSASNILIQDALASVMTLAGTDIEQIFADT